MQEGKAVTALGHQAASSRLSEGKKSACLIVLPQGAGVRREALTILSMFVPLGGGVPSSVARRTVSGLTSASAAKTRCEMARAARYSATVMRDVCLKSEATSSLNRQAM